MVDQLEHVLPGIFGRWSSLIFGVFRSTKNDVVFEKAGSAMANIVNKVRSEMTIRCLARLTRRDHFGEWAYMSQ
jgi:hypothetical protein